MILWFLRIFSFVFWLFSNTFSKNKAVAWQRETRSVLLIAMIMICLQNRAVGYIYHLTGFCECWRAEPTFLCEVHTQTQRDLKWCVIACYRVWVCHRACPNHYGLPHRAAHCINIHYFVCLLLTYLLSHFRVLNCCEAFVWITALIRILCGCNQSNYSNGITWEQQLITAFVRHKRSVAGFDFRFVSC